MKSFGDSDRFKRLNESVDNFVRKLDKAVESSNNLGVSIEKVANKTKELTAAQKEYENASPSIKKMANAMRDLLKNGDSVKALTDALVNSNKKLSEGYEDLLYDLQNGSRAAKALAKEQNVSLTTARMLIAVEADVNKCIKDGIKAYDISTKRIKENTVAKEEEAKSSKKVSAEQEKLAKAQERGGKASANAAKSTKNTGKEALAAAKDIKKLGDSLSVVIEKLSTLSSKKTTFRVDIANKDFNRVFEEMGKAVRNFQDRNKRSNVKGKNYFDQFIGTKEEIKDTSSTAIEEVKRMTEESRAMLTGDLVKNVQNKIKFAITSGIHDGVMSGLDKVNSGSEMASLLKAITKSLELKPSQREALGRTLFEIATGKEDTTAIKIAKIDANRRNRAAANVNKEKRLTAVQTREAELAQEERLVMNLAPNEYKQGVAAKARKAEAEAKTAELKYQQEAQKQQLAEDEKRKQRERWFADDKRYREMLLEFSGKDLSNLDKQKQKVREYTEQYQRLYQQAMNNKGNQDAHLRTLRELQKAQREYAKEVYKTSQNYDGVKKKAEQLHKVLAGSAKVFGNMYALTNVFGNVFNTLRAQANNLFGFFTNGFRRVSSQIRNQLTSAISSGVEQYKNLESAAIGFESFFGKDNVEAVMSSVRSEALKAPMVTAGELADYVRQLAPVSGGNANLAINSAMGALKTILYSGSDASEMEYIVKNIRDVIAKGTATAIDIRQFNRAVPGLEKALKNAGLDEKWLDSEGKLNITKDNAKQVLEMFANLNTAEDSPVKDIFDKMLNTLEGLQDVFKERKTTMVESILRESGIFDFMKEILLNFNDDGPWKKMENFFVGILKPIVQWIRSLNWTDIGNNLKNGFSIISETLVESKNRILETIREVTGSNVNMKYVFDMIWSAVQNFIKGFTEGVTQTIKFVNWLKSVLGDDAISKIAGAIGLLVSPFGKVISTMISLVASGFRGISQLFNMTDTFTQSLYRRKLTSIEKNAGEFASVVTSKDINGQIDVSPNVKKYGNAFVYNGQIIKKGVATNVVNRAGEAASWGSLSTREKIANVGVVDSVKSVFSKIGNVAGKAFSAAGVFMIGKGVTELVSNAVSSMNPGLGEITNQLGTAASAAFAVGSKFGPLAGAAAALTTTFLGLMSEADKLKEAQENLRLTTIEASLSQGKRDIVNNLLDNLQEAGLYDPYEEHSEGAYKAVLEAAAGMSNEIMKDPAKATEKLLDVYLSERGKTASGVGIEKWIDKGMTGSTFIGEADLGTLKSVAEGLKAIGQISLEEETVKELGDNYKSWQSYLKNQGFGFNTSETLNNFNSTLGTLTKTYDEWKNKELDIKLFYEDEEGNKQSFGSIKDNEAIAKWMSNNGFILKDGVWTTQAVIDMNINTPKTMTGSITDASRNKSNSVPERIGWSILDAANRFVGRGNPLLPWAEGGWFNWDLWSGKTAGGKIKPIYRASGGDTPARGVDTVPVMAQPGEFIMRRASVNKVGLSTMEALNRGDITRAAKLLGSKVNNSWNNARNWSNVVNNNQRSSRNQINIFNRNMSQRNSSYLGLANRISLA